MHDFETQLILYGRYDGDSCGYCKNEVAEKFTFGLHALTVSPKHYQNLIDRGFRRSGKFIYKPMTGCCKYYTIRLNSHEYLIEKSTRKNLNKMGRFLKEQNLQSCLSKDLLTNFEKSDPLIDLIKKNEQNVLNVKLVKSAFEIDSFNLYKKYQKKIHHDEEEKLTETQYKNFLVDSPLKYKENGICTYGSFHQKYFFGEKLIAIGVIDILPLCISSVYFIYDPDFDYLSLGVYGALREIAYTKVLSAFEPNLKYYYMGYYIHTCEKMKYKAKYKPSEFLCPVTKKFVKGEIALPKIASKNELIKLAEGEEDDQFGKKKVDFKKSFIVENGEKVMTLSASKKLIAEEFFNLAGIHLVDEVIIHM
ncbi:Arginyl-tRNA--protein transferase 1 [Clydaea vesicula]|uniref:Arginyl-tRNA--protein transferase 1 n=1 Tax=Clydaea vesicula TaxID=447962 RepID=A0AAD5U779_9FUNG|nr:Arginyl-tRNA--protein transferase 1 [Clydaea vesicula]KAJ3396183.1 Arginyl-tRNA--protein transferase 1 [Lobulomyces angularis]